MAAWRQGFFALALLALAAAALAGVWWGTAEISWQGRVDALFGREGAERHLMLIIREWRMPRVLMAGLVGAALALSGVLMQALLRNPLADPFLLGLSSGASAAAVGAIVWLPGWIVARAGMPLIAFLGAILAFVATLGLSFSPARGLDRLVIILAGIAVSLFFESITAFFLHVADPHAAQSALRWLMGSVSGVLWRDLLPLALALPVVALLALRLAPMLDAVLLGDERAAALGVPVMGLRAGFFTAAALLTGLSVAAVGIVGFVGLIVPHMARLLIGAGHRLLIPLSLILGALVVIVVDLLCRTLLAPEELPLSVLLALFAAPPFVVILRRARDGF